MDIRRVDPGEALEPLWDEAIADMMARVLGTEAKLELALATPAASHASQLPKGWRILAVAFPGGDGLKALSGYLSERMLRPGTVTELRRWQESDRSNFFLDEQAWWGVAWTDEALFLIDFDLAPYLDLPPEEQADVPDVAVALQLTRGAILPPGPAPTPSPTPSIADPDDLDPVAVFDPPIEDSLPRRAGSADLDIYPFADFERDLGMYGTGAIPLVLPELGRTGSDATLAVAAARDSTFNIWAHRVEGVSGDELFAATLLWLGLGGPGPSTAAEVNGRRYLINEARALYVQGDVLYWMNFLNEANCFWQQCARGPNPPLEDIARDAIAAIPEP